MRHSASKARLLLLFVLIAAPQAHADDEAVAHAYFMAGDLEQAYRSYRALAEVGYPHYLNILGDWHARGIGVPASDLMAHVWYSLSAAQKNPQGMEMKARIGDRLSPDQIRQSREIAERYAQKYLAPYISQWSLD
ncbi:MAG: hypothetical protein ACPG4N_09565 [Gammaproteobacteria bacterium]